MSEQQKELLQLAKLEAEEIEAEMAASQNMNLPNAFEDCQPHNFPMFATVKQLLYMLDASLYRPFFCRDADNKVISMESNLSWHNENKGLYMINAQHKSSVDYDALMLKYSS